MRLPYTLRLIQMVRPFGSVMTAEAKRNDLELLSVVIPARDEEGCIASTVGAPAP